jgi:Ca2+-binding EF-hand superfamily protein
MKPFHQTRLYVYYFLVIAITVSMNYFFMLISNQQLKDKNQIQYLYIEKYIICSFSAIFNVVVLYYHATHPPHPKFLMLKRRHFSILVHIISGFVEFLFSITAFVCAVILTYNTNTKDKATSSNYALMFSIQTVASRVAACAAIIGHIPSSFYQTSILFGAKAVMVPGYLFCIMCHLFCAIHLVLEPESTYWLLNMFCVFNVYAWVRFFMIVFGYTHLFAGNVYTVGVLFAGIVCGTGALGGILPFIFVTYVCVCVGLFYLLVQPDESCQDEFVRERPRFILCDPSCHSQWVKLKMDQLNLANEMKTLSDRDIAQKVFAQMDTNGSGLLETDEVAALLREWKMNEKLIQRICLSTNKNENKLSFDQFYDHVWRLNKKQQLVERRTKVNVEKARFVFDMIDGDCDGYVEKLELQKLLIQWGLPDHEVDEYMDIGGGISDRFTFEEFFVQMKPIWAFGYDNFSIISRPQH